jgi:hypothetical protein
MTRQTDIGEFISLFYAQFLELYGDEDIASVATAAVINDMLTAPQTAAVPDTSTLAA